MRINRRTVLRMCTASVAAALSGCESMPQADVRSSSDLHLASANDLAALLKSRKVSALELCQASISRIERLDKEVNAVAVRDFERALEAARSADVALARGDHRPLLGVPMTVKESFELIGHPTTGGVPERLKRISIRDAEVVRRVRAAGAVILGKTNVPLFLRDFQSFNGIYGRTGNPYRLTHSPGGSSGGAAAAIAMGFSALEIGSDFGGSIRIPAAFCGVYGLKTTFGTVSGIGHGAFSDAWSTPSDLQVIGPIARTPADLLLLLGVIAGPDEGSPATTLVFPPSRRQKLSDFRVFVLDDHPSAQLSDSIRSAVHDVERRLVASGAKVSRKSDRLPNLSEGARTFRTFLEGPNTGITSVDWLAAQNRQAEFRRRWASFFEEFDVVLAPTYSSTAFVHNETPIETRMIEVDGQPRSFMNQFAWLSMAGLGKLPAAVVPVGMANDALPIGLQVIAPYLGDLTAVHFASLIAREIPPPAIALT